MLTRKPTAIRCIAFLLAMLSISVVTFAAATHDDGDGPSCLLCKLGHEPIELAVAADSASAPLAVDFAPAELESKELAAPEHALRSRAPPV